MKLTVDRKPGSAWSPLHADEEDAAAAAAAAADDDETSLD
jgi:hypothetical protein